jgi:hypothetical protein
MRIPIAAALALLALAAPARAAIVPGATVDGPSAQIPANQSVSVDVAPDGSAAIAYLKNGDVYVSQLVNGAWTSGQRVDNLPAGEATRPDIAVANGGKIVVAFLEQSMAPSAIHAVVKPAGQPFPSTPAPELLTGLTGSFVDVDLAPNGNGYASFTVGAGTQHVRAARLSGITWSPVGGALSSNDGNLNSDITHNAGDAMHEPRVAVNGDGSSAVMAWAEDDGTMVYQVFARRLTGTGKGTAVRADLDSFGGADGTGKNADQLDVASDAAGNAWVGFRDNFRYGMADRGRAILRRFVGSAFEPPQLADSLGDPPPESIEFPKIAVNAAGQGLMGGYRQMTHSTQAAALDGSAWAPLGDINVTPNPGAAFSVPAIAESGNGMVAWVGQDSLVRARVRGNGSLGQELTLSQPTSGASNGFDLQAAADQGRFAVVAFTQGAAADARVVAAVVDLPARPTGGAGGGPTPDTLAPTVSRVRLSRRTFAVGRARTPVAAKLRKGTTISYSLSEAAGVRFKIERTLPGRRSGGRCRKPTKRLSKHRRCTRYRTAGTLRRSGAAGANRLAFSGRIGRRALKRGPYRLTVAATDAAGNASKAKRAKFRILRAAKRRARG